MHKIDAWSDQIITDYEHVFREFGLQRFPEHWGKKLDHYFFERGIVVAHRGFEKVMRCIESNKPFINITGIASSGYLHFGHRADIELFRFFKGLGARNYFALSDLDAYCSRQKIKVLEEAKGFAVDNAADAIALGLSEKDIYAQSNKPRRYYEFTFEISKKITKATSNAIYGEIDLGKIAANLLQYADIMHAQLKEFEGKMPSVTCIGLDQDPHARATRDITKRLPYGLEMPGFVYFRHQGGLLEGTKMSSSRPETAVFLNDSGECARKKIMNAFTGGRPTVEEQRKLGGKPEICKVHEMLLFHLPDSKELARIQRECRQGKWLCSECKRFTAEFVCSFLERHQKKKKAAMKRAERIVLG